MERFEWGDHIVFDPQIMVGKPTIKGTRLTAELVIDLLVAGWTREQMFESYPNLTEQGIRACLGYAAHVMRKEKAKMLRARRQTLREHPPARQHQAVA